MPFRFDMAAHDRRHLLHATQTIYNKIIQNFLNNLYAHAKSLQDQLQYHLLRPLELDIYKSKRWYDTVDGNWFVYHTCSVTPSGWDTHCLIFSDCLREFKAWSDTNPLHEPVTAWIDLGQRPGGRGP